MNPCLSEEKGVIISMYNLDREDIHEHLELSKAIDTENIPFEKLMYALISFIYDKLFTKDNFQKLNIDSENEMMIRNYAHQGKAFLDKCIAKELLIEARVSAWETHDRLPRDSASRNLLRIIIDCLYDKEDSEFEVHGSGEILEVFFSLLLDLGNGYCNQFRCYLQQKLAQ